VWICCHKNPSIKQLIAVQVGERHENLKSDLIGKYVERLFQERSQFAKPTVALIKSTYKNAG